MRDKVHSTPLLHAALNNQDDVARLLLKHEADPNVPDERGWTPLAVAAQKGYAVITRLLLQNSALCCAASRNNKECARLLLEARADVSIADVKGWTPLHYAVLGSAYSIVEMLLSHVSINIDAVDNKGQTPLAIAASQKGPSADAKTESISTNESASTRALWPDGEFIVKHGNGRERVILAPSEPIYWN